jgi:hypothetical protein
MNQLIEIKTVPIELEYRVEHAQMRQAQGTAELEITRDEGGLSIHSRPIQLRIDSFESRSSIRPTTMQATEQNAEKGRQAAYEATATYAQRGQLLLNTDIGQELITQFAEEDAFPQVDMNVNIEFLPTVSPDISWEPAELSIRYEMDKLNFDWRVNPAQLEFIPGDIQISVTQKPDVIIKYVGGPLYVPPSSEPSYSAEA